MNKIAKILSAVLSVTVALSIAIVMLTSAIAADAPKLSVNVKSESDKNIVIEVVLENGGFTAVDFGIEYNNAKITGCSSAKGCTPIALLSVEGEAASQAIEASTGKYSAAVEKGFDTKGTVIATYTLDKVAGTEISKEDIALVVTNCNGMDGSKVSADVVNNVPVVEKPTEAPTEKPTEAPTEKPTEAPTEKPTEAPTEKPTEAPTEKPTEAPTEKPTEAPTEKPTEAPTEKPTEAPTEKPTEAPTEKPTEAPTEKPTEPSTEKPTEAPTEKPTEAPTEKPEGDVVNPDTGDSVTATAAIVSLLAVSGAAIVALRKKED